MIQVAFKDNLLNNIYLNIESDNIENDLPFTQRQLTQIVSIIIATPNLAELSKLGLNYIPPKTEHELHSVKLNTEFRLHFKQLAENKILITKIA